MKVEVVKGYVSHNRRLFGVGACLDVDASAAERLIRAGVVKAVGNTVAPVKAEAPATKEPASEDTILPEADPAANVKPKRKARAKK
jgi:hypothetical protein